MAGLSRGSSTCAGLQLTVDTELGVPLPGEGWYCGLVKTLSGPSLTSRLPVHRRTALLARYALIGVTSDEVEILLREHADDVHRPFRPMVRRSNENEVALRGSDGKFHLCNGSGWPRCDRRYRYPAHRTDWTHDRVARRTFTLDPTTVTEPWLIHASDRCGEIDHLWPGWEGRSRLGRIRALLAERFGRMCQTCGANHATCIDHDHLTGIVRGLLCGGCNSWIDCGCLHVDDCWWASYLNEPPALFLGIRHPNHNGRRPLSTSGLVLPDRLVGHLADRPAGQLVAG